MDETEVRTHAVRFPFQSMSPILSLSLGFYIRKMGREGPGPSPCLMEGASEGCCVSPAGHDPVPVQLRAPDPPWPLSEDSAPHIAAWVRAPRAEAHSARKVSSV